MENPLRLVIKQKNLTPSQVARLSGTQLSWIYQLLRGDAVSLSGRVLDALGQLGYDRAELSRDYANWRHEQAQRLKDRLVSTG